MIQWYHTYIKLISNYIRVWSRLQVIQRIECEVEHPLPGAFSRDPLLQHQSLIQTCDSEIGLRPAVSMTLARHVRHVVNTVTVCSIKILSPLLNDMFAFTKKILVISWINESSKSGTLSGPEVVWTMPCRTPSATLTPFISASELLRS